MKPLQLNVSIANIALLSDKGSAQVGRGRRTKTSSLEAAEQTTRTRASKAAEDAVGEKQDFKVNEEGRYVCPMCDKTFKTVSLPLTLFVNILCAASKKYLLTHSFPLQTEQHSQNSPKDSQ